MTQAQIVFGVVLVVALLGLAAIFFWRQWRALASLKHAPDLPIEDRVYVRNQAVRRLICAVLMVVLAVMLVWSFSLEWRTGQILNQEDAARERGEKPPPRTALDKEVLNQFSWHWIATLIVLFAIIVLAGMDFFAIRRFGKRQYKKIQTDRRNMIERELMRIRGQRNGHG
jgi:hypothetical protein